MRLLLTPGFVVPRGNLVGFMGVDHIDAERMLMVYRCNIINTSYMLYRQYLSDDGYVTLYRQPSLQ